MKYKISRNFFFCIFMTGAGAISSQEQSVDRIIATVGNSIVLQSEVEIQYVQVAGRGDEVKENTRCRIFEDLLFQKLLYNQAKKDSVSINESQVDGEIDRRMRYFMGYFGSEEKFMEFYGKSPEQFKQDIRNEVKEFLMAKQVNDKIGGDIKVSPAEVKVYFESIPPDSIPFITSEVELGQIIRKAPVSPEAKKAAKERAEELRQRILKGADFATLAILNSEDPGSAKNGGRYDNIQRGQFVPEFDAISFKQKEGEISEVFETSYGFHFVQTIQRRGDFVDLRHILITAKVSSADLQKAKELMDSIYTALQNDTISFSDLAGKYSDDEETKISGGLLQNPSTGATTFSIEELGQMDPNLVFAIDKMKVGEVSKPVLTMTSDGKQAYKIIFLKSRTEPHKANMKDDYQRIQNIAKAIKEQNLIKKWTDKKMASTYIKIADDMKNCKFQSDWVRYSN